MCREALARAERAILDARGGVAVRNLQLVRKDVLVAMKAGETEKRKSYRAVCWASRALTKADAATLAAATDLVIQQGTPVRVLHRRAPLVRERVRPGARKHQRMRARTLRGYGSPRKRRFSLRGSSWCSRSPYVLFWRAVCFFLFSRSPTRRPSARAHSIVRDARSAGVLASFRAPRIAHEADGRRPGGADI